MHAIGRLGNDIWLNLGVDCSCVCFILFCSKRALVCRCGNRVVVISIPISTRANRPHKKRYSYTARSNSGISFNAFSSLIGRSTGVSGNDIGVGAVRSSHSSGIVGVNPNMGNTRGRKTGVRGRMILQTVRSMPFHSMSMFLTFKIGLETAVGAEVVLMEAIKAVEDDVSDVFDGALEG